MLSGTLNKLFRIVIIFAIFCCCVLLFPQVQGFIIGIAEGFLGRDLNDPVWMKIMLNCALVAIFCFILIFLTTFNNIQFFLEKYKKIGENIFVIVLIMVVIMSIIVRLIMYVKCRSLWLDEAFLAESIVTRNWSNLLMPPLANSQSAPVLYVISVKLFGFIFGYSEFSLRLFSLLSFVGLLVCETIFLKRVFDCSNLQISSILAMTALLPTYIRYSNEFKPYMSDAFFIILTFLLYFYYTQNKLKLPLLTALYIVIIGFSSPSIFFIGGILSLIFFDAIFNKKKITNIFISGVIFLLIFTLYYHWWMSPVTEAMKTYWNNYIIQLKILTQIKSILSNSLYIMLFVPISVFGIISLCKSKNKIAFSVILSLIFTFLASAIDYWPKTTRLWLFLPSIVLIFTPVGFNYLHNKIQHIKIIKTLEFIIYTIIISYFSVNCLGYTNAKMYHLKQEINPLIDYIQKNINDDEKLYVYPYAKYAFEYKIGYNVKKIGNTNNNNIIFGINTTEWNEDILGNELHSILEYKKVFIIFQHHYTGIDKGLEVLRNYGTLTEVMNVYDTPLYYFERGSQ